MTQPGWTAADIPDQSGRTIIVTGANSGLGLEATRALTAAGAHVVMACRDLTRAEAARAEVEHGDRAEVLPLDLADLDSVRAFVSGLDGRPVDVLVNNAGLMNIPHSTTAQGVETQFGVNVLGHFALTREVLPQLTDRVVWLGSQMHRLGRLDLTDLDRRTRRYNPMTSYCASKLACVMLAYEQQRRFEAEGSPLRAVAAHPGYSSTNLQYRSGSGLQDRIMSLVAAFPLLVQDARRGALPGLYAATVPDLPGGSYIGPNGPGELTGFPHRVDSNARSKDRAVAAELWERCEEWTTSEP